MTLPFPIRNDASQASPAARREIPTAGECEAILARQRLPKPVIRHSRKVAEIAMQIADALAATGLAIDPELVCAGGLLHDVAKGQPNHAKTGAAILCGLGMPAVAAVVAVHTEMSFTGAIDERAIVHLADKLASGDRLVTLDERFATALLRFRDNPDALDAALRRKAVAQQIASAIEAKLGAPITVILRDSPAIPARQPAISTVMEAEA